MSDERNNFGRSSEEQIHVLEQVVKLDFEKSLDDKINETLQQAVEARAKEIADALRPYCPCCNGQPEGLSLEAGQPTKCSACGSQIAMIKLPELLLAMRKGYENVRAEALRVRHHLQQANAQVNKWVEEHRRVSRQVAETSDLYFHPTTNTFIHESETTSAGIIGRIRIGWAGPVYRVFNEQERAKMIEFIQQQGRDEALVAVQTAGRLTKENEQLTRRNTELQTQVAHLKKQLDELKAAKAAGVSRGRRSIDI